MTGSILLLASAVAFAAPPDRGESGFSVDSVPVEFSADPGAVIPAPAGLESARALPPTPAEEAVAPGVRARRTAVRTVRQPLRSFLNGQWLARPPGSLPGATDEVSDGPGRSDGIPPSGPAGISP